MRRTHCMFDPLQSMSNGSPCNRCPRAEARAAEAYLKQYVEATRGEPAQPTDYSYVCRRVAAGESAVAAEPFMDAAGSIDRLESPPL